MRKVINLSHVHKAESYNIDSVEQLNQNVKDSLDIFTSLGEDNMVCVIIRQKMPNGQYRISSLITTDINTEEIIIDTGCIDKLIIQGRSHD